MDDNSKKQSTEEASSVTEINYAEIKFENENPDTMPEAKAGNDEPAEKDNDKTKVKMVGFFEVFRFSTSTDRLLMLLGTVAACAHGAAMPLMMIVFGDVTDLFITIEIVDSKVESIVENLTNSRISAFQNLTKEYIYDNTGAFIVFLRDCGQWLNLSTTHFPLDPDSSFCSITNALADELEELIFGMWDMFMDEMQRYALYYTYIGIAALGLGYLQMMCWRVASYNQSERIRTSLFRSILKQEIGWFDTHESGELTNRLVDDVDLIEKGIGDKVALFFQYTSAFVTGFIVGFVFGWKLTLVIVSVSPLLAISGGFMAVLMSSMTKRELEAYAKAGAVAEEVLGAMRTVTAFGGQEKESIRYNANLDTAQSVGVRKGLITGLGMGAVWFIMFGSYGLAFWYGSQLVRDDEYTAGTMIIVFFSVLMGAFSIGAATPNIQDYSNARGAAFIVYNMIDQVSKIDVSSPDGLKKEKITGNIEFKDIIFRYPSRPTVQIFNGFSLKINQGETVALVGSSGCGKSTCIQLIQRFYDAEQGEVLVDGRNIKDYNLKWLRQQIGVVSQEPVLFGTTIAENIRYGREDATMDDIERAAKEANAFDFISKLPQQFDTMVGERGAQLSGGQKQRIAIARALVRNPTILLLDEATSALDTESESIVQAALDKASQGRTTVIVAHRLTTIRTADVIAGLSNGVVVEQGSHADLMTKQGVYYTLATNQMQMKEKEALEDDTELKPVRPALEKSLSHQSTKRQRTVSSTSGALSTGTASDTDDDTTSSTKEENLPDPPIFRILKLNSPELGLMIAGCIAAIVMGLIQPAFAIVFSNILGVFSEPIEVQEEKCNLYSGMFVVIGVVAGLANFVMFAMFSKSGENLTSRLRRMAFIQLLRQDIAYFDDHANGTGALCSRLSTDAAAVKGATGSRLATLIQSFGAIGCGIAIGFIYSWKLTLLVLGFAPFMLIGAFIEMQVFTGAGKEKSTKMESAAKVAAESIENIRTVANLTREEKFYQLYASIVNVPYSTSRKKAHLLGIAYSYSQAIIFFANAGCFMFGAWLVRYDGLHYQDMFKVFTAIIFGAMAAGQASSFAPDYSKAKIAAARMFNLLDRVPPIDSYSQSGDKLVNVSGSVELKDIRFSYPTRPDVAVLKGVSVAVKPGQVVALVGSSGCGKSTIVQLIERFYDPSSGSVILDGCETQKLNLQWLRSQIGIVSQEPILFDCSIRENIAYGDNTRLVAMEEIIASAKQANIHSFIEALPQGYETNVGDKGTQLSGGQKQRVAIARALVRNPKILLLDEATSALDTESEKIVQEALERAQQGRTSIVIAHRLSTIKNSDRIIVIHNGLIAEVGTHSELLALKGYYYRLNAKQGGIKE